MSSAAGGVDKRQLEIEMNSTLGDLPKLSTISTSIKDDATEFRTQHPYILALVLILLGLAVGGCVAYTAGFIHGQLASSPSPLPTDTPTDAQTKSPTSSSNAPTAVVPTRPVAEVKPTSTLTLLLLCERCVDCAAAM